MSDVHTTADGRRGTGRGPALKRAGVAVGLVVVALLITFVIGFVIGLAAVAAAVPLTPGLLSVVDLFATQLAFALVALAFLHRYLGWDFVSIARPTGRELRFAGVLLALVTAVEALRQLSVRYDLVAEAGTLGAGEEISTTAAVVIFLLTVLAAPLAEELLFRGVIQEYVGAVATPAVGIAVATVLFVPMHGLGILTSTSSVLAGAMVVLVLVILSVALGVAYGRTENLAAPILLHAGYNVLATVLVVGIHGGPLW